MKTLFITFLMSFALSSVVSGQSYKDGKEYKAQNNTYKCKYDTYKDFHYFEFSNTKNVLENMNSGIRGYSSKSPVVESKRKVLELLYDVYGGNEKMQAMGVEVIDLYFYVGMDYKAKELKITISSDTKYPKTTIFQVESIENLLKEHIRFIFERESPLYRDALYETMSFYPLTISEIPELLEKTP